METKSNTKYKRTILLWVVAAFTAAIIIVVFIFDPAQHIWMPKCAFHALTGYSCPSCGNSRLLYHLLHGDILGAWHYNYFMLIALPFVILIIYAYASASETAKRLRDVLFRPRLVFLYAFLILAWWIIRNVVGI